MSYKVLFEKLIDGMWGVTSQPYCSFAEAREAGESLVNEGEVRKVVITDEAGHVVVDLSAESTRSKAIRDLSNSLSEARRSLRALDRVVDCGSDGDDSTDILLRVSAQQAEDLAASDLSDFRDEIEALMNREWQVTLTYTVRVSRVVEAKSEEEARSIVEDEDPLYRGLSLDSGWEEEDVSLDDVEAWEY